MFQLRSELSEAHNKLAEPFPLDPRSCLSRDTAWWKRQGWSLPPGSQRVLYWRKRSALQVESVVPGRTTATSASAMFLFAPSRGSASPSNSPSGVRLVSLKNLHHHLGH